MRPVLTTVCASLLAAVLIAPAAQGATQVRQVQVEVADRLPFPPPPNADGTLILDFVFKNKRGARNKFTPRQLTRIDFSKLPLSCFNAPVDPTGTSQLLLSTTLETAVKLKKAPPPSGGKPKPGRYAFNYAYGFPAFTGTISGTIDRKTIPDVHTGRGKLRSNGKLTIEDLDSDPGHSDCSTGGLVQWGGLPLTQR